jgi:hypothetical protein
MKFLPIRNLFEVTADLRSGLRGRRRAYLTFLKRAGSANFKMVWYVLLRLRRPELLLNRGEIYRMGLLICRNSHTFMYSLPTILPCSGHRRTYLTILEFSDHALFKMVRYVLLRPLRPELDVIHINCRVRFCGNLAVRSL